ncbi:hypothetical protein ABZ086_33300, partial [Streptomyces halstedii]
VSLAGARTRRALASPLRPGRARAHYKRLNAKVITVDPGEAIVRQRVKDMRQPAMDAVVTRWYRDRRRGGSRPVTTQASRSW